MITQQKLHKNGISDLHHKE